MLKPIRSIGAVPSLVLSALLIAASATATATTSNDNQPDKKEVGEASYNIQDCEDMHDGDDAGTKPGSDSEDDLDECTPVVK